MNTKVFPAFALALSLAGFSAQAQFAPNESPNNTNTHVVSAESNDGVVQVRTGYLFQHLYGRDLMLSIHVANLSRDKEIYVVNDSSHESWKAEFAGDRAYLYNAAAQWMGTRADNRDEFLVRIKGYHTTANVYSVYVKMDGNTYAVRGIRLK